MSTQLSNALKSYYKKKRGRILFRNSFSLTSLSLEIWEQLGYKSLDSSVLSKVLSGKRLFSPEQLQAFCKVLDLSEQQYRELFNALHEDLMKKHGFPLIGISLGAPSSDCTFLESIIVDTESLLYEGKIALGEKFISLVISYIEGVLSNNQSVSHRQKYLDLLAQALYLKGRFVGGRVLPKESILLLMPIARRVYKVGKRLGSKHHIAQSYNLVANAYYTASEWPYCKGINRKWAERSIFWARKALDNFSPSNADRHFAAWMMYGSMIDVRDGASFQSAISDSKLDNLLIKSGKSNPVQKVQLSMMIARGKSQFKLSNPFKLADKMRSEYAGALKQKGIQEAAAVRVELLTLFLLKSQEKEYMRGRAQEGLLIAKQEESPRLVKVFENMLERI